MSVSSPQLPKSSAGRPTAASRATPVASSATQSRWFAVLSVVILVGAVVAVYWNSLSGAMVLDDFAWIRENPSIHQLSIGDILLPKNMGPLGGRPLLSLTLAIN